uniref:Uncharacterized protein n=1 Tax=Toxoplasma gondii COUG TaxID=1074873 RepID=A0A2G8YE92_TOXGO|nr:hypothetical protein TGCOUG_260825 [Toxoplasma gondii COUG]
MAYLYYPTVTLQRVTNPVAVYPATYVPTGYYVSAAVPLYCCYTQPPCCHCVRIAHAEANKRNGTGSKCRGRSHRRISIGQSDYGNRSHSPQG